MEATSSTEGAPREGVACGEARNGGEAPTDYQDASGDTSNAEGGMVTTNRDRELLRAEVVEVLGVMLPPGAGFPDNVPTVTASSTDAPNPTGTGFQRIQRREDLDVSTHAPEDPPHDPTLGAEGRVERVQGPDLVQRLQKVAIARLCQERDQLHRQLAEARVALPAAVAAERDRLAELEARAAQLGRECERLRRESEGLRRRRERWKVAVVAQATLIALMQTLEPDPRDQQGPESQQ